MIHKIVVVLFTLCIVVCLVAAQGVDKIKSIASGRTTVTLLNIDSTALMTTGMTPSRITKPANPNNVLDDGEMYDAVIGLYYIDTFIATTACSGCNAVNRIYITTYAGQGWKKTALSTDTCTALPCSLTVYYAEDYHQRDVGGETSGTGIWVPSQSTVQYALTWDNLWFDYIVVDTAGTGDTLTAAIKYEFRGIELE